MCRVVQEFLLARDVQVICGAETLHWPIVESFIRRIDKENKRRPSNPPHAWSRFLQTPAFRLMQQRVFHHQHLEPLADLLVSNSNTECFEPRDKIYAMLGLAKDGIDADKIQVSYTIDKRPLLFNVIQYIRPQARDVLRWARFLIDVLKIDRRQLQHDLAHEFESDIVRHRTFAVHGFTTGRVTRCGPINASLQLQDSENIHSSTELHSEWIARLESCLKALRSASQRPHENFFGFSVPQRVFEVARASSITVYTFGCIEKKQLAGVAYGNIRPGNTVVQFLGNDIAIVLDTVNQKPNVSGCLMFSRSDSTAAYQETRDRITGHPCLPYNIQSGADCVESESPLRLELGPPEILAISQ